MEKLKQNPIIKKLGLNRILLVGILILMFVVFKVVLGDKFPVGDSIRSTLNYVYFLGFLSLGVTFVSLQEELISPSDRLCSAVHWFPVTA